MTDNATPANCPKTIGGTSMASFAEALPNDCPPATAVDELLESVFRLVANDPPTSSDFASHMAAGRPCPSADKGCQWCSCSLFLKAKTLRKYSRLRAELPYLAELKIPAGNGKFVKGATKRGHIDFWRYSDVELNNYVINVEGPDNDK